MPPCPYAYPHQLSGGQRQRVMIANGPSWKSGTPPGGRATTALDTLVQKDILDLMFDLQKRFHLSMLFISHNLRWSPAIPNVCIMREGEIVESGPTLDILHHPTHPYTKQLWAAIPH